MGTADAQRAALSKLCSTCRDLDFEEIFTLRAIPATGTEIATIGKKPPDPDKISCGLCRYFHQIRSNYTRNYSRHVRLFDHITPSSGQSSQDESKLSRSRFLSVIRKNSRLRYDTAITEEIRQAGIIGYLRNNDRDDCDVRKIDASAVEYQSICRQIGHCSTRHLVCKPNRPDGAWSEPILGFTIPGLLIDCIQENLVMSKPGDQYITLSYVWGSRRDPGNDTSHAFSLSNAPLTIRDAVQVVRNLGRRFLWVDRYCIDQTDESSKSLMIGHMDDIYERSEVTIVALHGQDDEGGLPGVSAVSRIPQQYYESRKGSLISSCPPIRTLIEKSRWNTRAWTYQEARLSRRCLFFSEHQVYFVCNQCTWSEAVPFEPSRNHLTRLLNSQRLDAVLFGSNSSVATGYFYDRLEYSKRSLSFEKDILDGFRGILQRSSFITFWGLPISLQNSGVDPNVGLALGLLWMRRPGWATPPHIQTASRKRSSRRLGFPTWSWTSLIADIYQDNYGPQSIYGQYINGLAVDFPQNEARTRFWLSIKGLGILRAEDMNMDNAKILGEDSPELSVEGEFITLPYRCREPHHRWYLLFGRWIYFQPDIFDEDQIWPRLSSEDDFPAEDQVFVLIQWNESQRSSFRRLLLMVVEWIDDIHAERRGLLTTYRDEFRAEEIYRLPRIRKHFRLQ